MHQATENADILGLRNGLSGMSFDGFGGLEVHQKPEHAYCDVRQTWEVLPSSAQVGSLYWMIGRETGLLHEAAHSWYNEHGHSYSVSIHADTLGSLPVPQEQMGGFVCSK